MQIRKVMTSCPWNGKILEILRPCSSIWHQKCSLQKKQNDMYACWTVAMTTILPLVLSKLKTKIPSFYLNQEPFTPATPMIRVKTLWQPNGMFVPSKPFCLTLNGWNYGYLVFDRKRPGAKRVSLATTLWVLLAPKLKNAASIFPEIFFIRYFTILVTNLMTLSLSNLSNTKASYQFPFFSHFNFRRKRKKRTVTNILNRLV